MRASSRGLALATLALLASIAFASPASAHAELIRSDPADGGVSPAPPSTVDLWFDEDVAPEFSSAELLDSLGTLVGGTRLVPDPDDPRHLSVLLPRLEQAAYGVMWHVLTEDDGHTTSGTIVFSVGAEAGAAPPLSALPETGSVSTGETALRWIRICLFALIVGGMALVFLVLERPAPVVSAGLRRSIEAARRHVLLVVLAATLLAIPVGIVALLAQVGGLPGNTPTREAIGTLLSSTRTGHLWFTRELALVLLAGLTFVIVRRAAGPQLRTGLGLRFSAVALVLVVVTAEAVGGHVASSDAGATALFASSLHVLMGLLWLGALPALALVLLPTPEGGASPIELVRALGGSFSRMATASVLIVVATGLYVAGREVRMTSDLVDTAYGRILLVKAALLACVGGVGLLNSARLHGWHPSHLGPFRRLVGGEPSRRLIAAEAAVGAVLLLAAGLLADTPPALAGASPARPSAPSATQSLYGSVEDLVVSVSITPNRPGVNGFTVIVASSRRPPPAPVDRVRIALASGAGVNAEGSIDLQEVADGRYFGSSRLDGPGEQRLTVIIDRGRAEPLTVPLHWSVAAAAPPPIVASQGRRLAPIADVLALVLLFGAGLAFGAWRLRSRRRSRRPRLVALPPLIEERTPEVVP